MAANVRSYKAKRITLDHVQEFDDTVAVETPLTLYVNDEEFVTLVCTPDCVEELITGFLASEGLIRGAEDIGSLTVDTAEGVVWASLPRLSTPARRMFGKRILTSCCGRGRTSFYFFNDARTARKIIGTWTVSPEACFRAMASLQQASQLFHATGGIHHAALAQSSGDLVAVRADVGRHNALDKLYGWALRGRFDATQAMVVFSGRVSSEVLLKVAKMGAPILLSKSAPTDLGLRLADELGVTVAGFLRGNGMNVYTHAERIADDNVTK
ncbi:MAG: formate dehydrogenase accessory sulfurtransferase FdhD [Kyrpidia tusciae]|nr:formate dehydrogenase accessory sulfurtransferase FdhD [Kyrpidia tusciae]MBE3551990.1 formate dehydrogenase accessory sulfurtransferase FdhD [Kyrpidia tusciae]